MRLLVVIEDKTADWIKKGEILSGYFNPSSAFQSITVLGLTEDKANEQVIKALCKPATSRFIGAKSIDQAITTICCTLLTMATIPTSK